MEKPIRVMMAFTNPLLVRAIRDVLGNLAAFELQEGKLSAISCDDIEEIDVILCETESLALFEQQHVCLAPKTLGISVWNNMISVSKGDLQSYDELDEIIAYIEKIAALKNVEERCTDCNTDKVKH
ncbi:hypothetical protein BHU72_02575 [Desulfuribacillus stibiiarsenatis]|uniref:Uncharacterized protein n=1 Tax=Desulfuribacillus stibiiarsenatis TaxID=1390249 RepID=A0A1E5L6U0_9FIRM|nr:hypothetical protein [Desulfuribacillus stibiiarsenatis]OEH85699.1 hypothetical protein BHU72_02575 [Desulfuribacillus stibiiarsenatis]